MISEVIKRIRAEHKLTQQDLANQLFVSSKTISSWENNRTIPDIYVLEKLSDIYHIQMNDLMAGNISKFSILKYKVKQIWKKVIALVINNLYFSIIIGATLIAFILLGVLSPLSFWVFTNMIIFSAIITMIIKFSKAYIGILIFLFYDLIWRMYIIIDVESYALEDALGNLDFLYPLFSWTLLGTLFLVILFGLYLFIIKSENRFYHIFTVVSCFIWIVIMLLYQSSYHFIRGYSSFSSEWWYKVEKDDNFLLYAVGYIALIDMLLVAHKIFKGKVMRTRKQQVNIGLK